MCGFQNLSVGLYVGCDSEHTLLLEKGKKILITIATRKCFYAFTLLCLEKLNSILHLQHPE